MILLDMWALLADTSKQWEKKLKNIFFCYCIHLQTSDISPDYLIKKKNTEKSIQIKIGQSNPITYYSHYCVWRKICQFVTAHLSFSAADNLCFFSRTRACPIKEWLGTASLVVHKRARKKIYCDGWKVLIKYKNNKINSILTKLTKSNLP